MAADKTGDAVALGAVAVVCPDGVTVAVWVHGDGSDDDALSVRLQQRTGAVTCPGT